MPDNITIEPVTRVEGHAKVTIELDKEGEVSDTKLQILQVRGFEKFMEGRQIEHAPILSPRICGICTEAHHVCSAKAVDDFFNVNPPEPALKLRRLLHYAGIIQSHILHFYFLASPDFLFPDTKEKRNVMGIVDEKPDLAKKVIDARKKAKQLTKSIGGKEIHPTTATAGGMTKPITERERQKHMEDMESILEFGEESVELGRNLIEKRKELLDSLGGVDSYQMALVNDGYHEVYDGQLRILDSQGNIVNEFDPSNYSNHIAERVQPHSYLKFPYLKKEGFPEGGYRVNALPRINACDEFRTEKAQTLLEEFRSEYGKPLKPLLYNYARLIEIVHLSEECMKLLEDERITKENKIRTDVSLDKGSGEGIGVVEAPRGGLFHHYKANEDGILTDVNLIVATVQNNIPCEKDAHQIAEKFINNGEVDDEILNHIEMLIRSYDPCLSCASHAAGGKHPLKIEIVDSEGSLKTSLDNFKNGK